MNIPYHLYVGQKIEEEFTTRTDNKEKRIGILTGMDTTVGDGLCQATFRGGWRSGIRLNRVKLILRRLDSMNNDELKEVLIKNFDPSSMDIVEQVITKAAFVKNVKSNQPALVYIENSTGKKAMYYFDINALSSNQFLYLLSKGFWLFDDQAFDEGLIIDAATVKYSQI